ncbi:RNA polymerase sigma factor [Bacillus sp. JJ722]|uniref:RNA polymerase sigma factor n=1 Tax=Bacillus sp. JJ722 TaxID=3122973 RepID=UPI002FFE4839
MNQNDLNHTFTSGGETELNSAIEQYGQPLLRYCHNILCDYYEAQDAVQITFIKAYKKRKSFTSGTSLSAWLYRIAYTTCIDTLRKKKLLLIRHSYKNDDSTFMNEDLKAALSTLSPQDRALVFSRVIDEKNYTELEEIYRIPASTLRKRFERAKKKLANELKENNDYYEKLEERNENGSR